MMNNKELLLRTNKFISELGVSRVAFARNVGTSSSTIYKWQDGIIELSEKILGRIDQYLKHYGF